MTIYHFTHYKDWIRNQINQNKKLHGYQARLADAAACHPSYLSQSLNGKPHLTTDQLIGIGQFCNLSNEELTFILDLHAFEKASSIKTKDFYQQRIDRALKRQQDVTKRIKKRGVKNEEQMLFYSHWMYGAIYTCTLLTNCKTIAAISSKLLIPIYQVQEIVNKLLEANLLEKKGDEYIASNADIHLSKDSQFLPIHLRNWRDRAMEHAFTHRRAQAVHFSAVYTVSKKDFDKLMEHFLQVIEYARDVTLQSKNETEVATFNIDWFRINR